MVYDDTNVANGYYKVDFVYEDTSCKFLFLCDVLCDGRGMVSLRR